MTDDLRTRIKEEVLDGILSMFSENDSVEMAAGYIADAVIRELEADYILVPRSHTLDKAAEEWLKS